MDTLHNCGIIPVLTLLDPEKTKMAKDNNIPIWAIKENSKLIVEVLDDSYVIPICKKWDEVVDSSSTLIALEENLWSDLELKKDEFPENTWILYGNFSELQLEKYMKSSFVCAICDTSFSDCNLSLEEFGHKCIKSYKLALGYGFAHLGINNVDDEKARETASLIGHAFGFSTYDIGSSIFASGSFEVVKSIFKGTHGHIGIETNSVARAMADLDKKNFVFDLDTIQRQPDGRIVSVYLKDDIGGFAFHLLQKR